MLESMDVPCLLRKELCPFVEGCTYMIKDFVVVAHHNLVHPLYQIVIYPFSRVYEMTVVIPDSIRTWVESKMTVVICPFVNSLMMKHLMKPCL